VGPVLRLLVLPALGLVAARLAAFYALAAAPGLGLVGQLALAVAVSGAVFAAVVLALAPRRIVAMGLRLHRALLGAAIV
jgi:hypothetical protein